MPRMGARRANQHRFEAWVPASLYEQFRGLKINRAAWLRQAMLNEIAERQRAEQSAPVHHHRRIESGQFTYSLGTRLPIYVCADCGERL